MTSGVKTSPFVERRIVKLLEQGWSYRDVARETQVNLVTVARIGKATGGDRRRLAPIDGQDDSGLPDSDQKSVGSVVYIIGSDELNSVKIGYSGSIDNLLGRLENGQVFCPFKLQILVAISGTMKDEKRLHQRFSSFHVRGEWFSRSNEIERFIARHRLNSSRKAWEIGKLDYQKS